MAENTNNTTTSTETRTASAARARRRGQTQPEPGAPARPFLVVDGSDSQEPPCTATAGEAADALGIDVEALLWAIDGYGRCDGAGGLLVVPLTGHDEA